MRQLSKGALEKLNERIKPTEQNKGLVLDLGKLRIYDNGMVTLNGAPMMKHGDLASDVLYTLAELAMEIAEFQRQAAERSQPADVSKAEFHAWGSPR